jgi:fibronectin-binding autotransporter adhesin
MKAKAKLRHFLAISASSLLAFSSARAATYYWDGNDSTAGFGTAGGTWADPTTGTLTSGWSTDITGATVVDGNSVSTTTADSLNFGLSTTGNGLAAGTITVSGTVNAGSITFGSQSGTITLSGGTINLPGAATITVNNTMVIDSLITGAGTSFTKAGPGTLRLTNPANTYTGATLIGQSTSGVLEVTALANGGVASSIGASSSAAGNLVLSNINAGVLRYIGATNTSTDRLFTLGNQQGYAGGFESSGTGTLILTNTGSLAFAQANVTRVFSLGGTNTGQNILNTLLIDNVSSTGALSFIKNGTGTWVVANTANSFTGSTTINGGTLSVSKMTNYGDASPIGKGTAGTAITMGSSSTLLYTGTGDNTDRSVNIAGASNATILNNGTGALNFTAATFNTGTTNSNNREIRLGGTNGGTISGVVRDHGATAATGYTQLVKNGRGTWILAGSNTYTGSTTLSAGTLKLDYSTNNDSKLSNWSTIGVLTLSGGTLELYGGSHAETVLSTTFNNGTTFIKQTGGGSSTLSMGAISLSAGAVDFAADNIATTTATNNAAGILNLRSTIAGANYATVSSGNIVALPEGSYTTFAGTLAGNTIYKLEDSGSTSVSQNQTTAGLRITTTQGGQSLALGNNFTIGSIFFSGAHDYSITLAATRTLTPSIVQNYGTGTLTLGALGGALSQYGTGKTALTANSTADVGINIFGGTVQFSNNLQIGNNTTTSRAIVLNNGTLVADTTSADIALNNAGNGSRTVTLGAGGGTLDVIGGNKLTVSGVISDTAGQFPTLTIGSGTSDGTIEFTATNTYAGTTIVSGGTLALGHATNTLADASLVNVNGGTLSIGGNVDTVRGVTLTSGSITGTGGTLTGSFYDVRSGSISAILGGTTSTLTKSTAGTVTLSGANTFTGATAVNDGTLAVSGSLSGTISVNLTGGTMLLSSGSEKVNDNALLTLNGGILAFGETAANQTETFKSLTLSGNATLDFGAGGGADKFLFSFTGGTSFARTGGILTINNWTGNPSGGTDGTDDRLVFSGSYLDFQNAFDQNSIAFTGYGTGYAAIDLNGSQFEVVAVPEPSSAAMIAAAAVLGLGGMRRRRRA